MWDKVSPDLKVLIKHYRPELIVSVIVLILCAPLFQSGHITFSDLAFGRVADEYLNYVMGVFNEELGTPNWFNLPRLTWITPAYIFGKIMGNSGHLFVTALIYSTFIVGVFSFGSLYRRLVRDSKHPLSEIGLIGGALIFNLNPWVMIRIQHIFILCGYALVPLALSWTWELLGKESWGKSGFYVPPSTKELRKFLLLGLAVSSSFAGIHFGVFIILMMIAMGIILATTGLWGAFKQRCLFSWLMWYSVRAALTGATFLLFAAYWVMPFVLSIVNGIRPSQNNVNAIETVVNFSRAADPKNLALGISYWWPMFDHSQIPATFWSGGFVVLSIAGIGILYSRRLFLALLSSIVFLLATGTHYPELAPKYISLVFDSMYPFGDMIRDPNKLYGVFILPVSIYFAYGFGAIEQGFKRFLNQYSRPLTILSTGITAIAGVLWLGPVYNVFMVGYYSPVEWPEPYDRLQAQLQTLPTDSKVLYLPVSDFATFSSTGLATPDFNHAVIQDADKYKATGDHMAFDTRMDTIFPFEGNDMMVMYFLQFIHNKLDDGNITQLGGLLAKAGLTHLVMRRDYEYLTERLNGFKNLLDTQEDLSIIWENEFMTLYEVQGSQGDAQYFKHLSYTTGGLERMLWFPKYFETTTKNVNLLFAYDGHHPEIEHLHEGEIVEVTSQADLWMTQLPPEKFVYPADSLRTASPHTNWAKLITSGHDWEHVSKHYKLENHKHLFDMGHGFAFTTSPISIPHKAFVPPDTGIPLLEENLSNPESFFQPFEHFQISATNIDGNTFGIEVPGTVPATEWQMLQTASFPLEELMLYHAVGGLEGLPDSVDFKLRIGYYSKDGNRLGTMFADPDSTIPTPETLTQSQTFLTPKGTTHGKFEIRVLNPTETDIAFTLHNLRLFSLKNFATPNSVMVTIPRSTEKDIQETNGYLWVRSLCSKNGGTVHITTENFDKTLNTICGPVSKFVWTPLKTTTNLEGKEVTLTNKTGINAINALMWMSDAEMAKLQQDTLQKIQTKTILHLIDSVDLDSNGAVESHHINSDWIGGTTLRGLNSTVFTTVDIVKDGTYALDIMDILPSDNDVYVVTLKSTTNSEIVVQSTITPSDERRTPRHALHSGRTRIPSLELKHGQYTLEIQLKSQSQPLLSWDDMDNPDVPECVLTDESTRTRTRTLPMWEKNWGSLNSEIIPYNKRDALMLRFLFANVDCRSLHGKIRFLDEQGLEVGVTYLDQTAHGTSESSEYVKYAAPPEGTEQLMVQFMARHMEDFSESAKYDIGELSMWAESSSIGIDAIAILETTWTDWTAKDVWEDEQQHRPITKIVTRGQRSFQLDTSMTQSHRLQFYESPIHHWIMRTGKDRVMPYAINGFAFGIELPEDVDTLRSEIILNSTWNRGVALLIFGLLGILGLSIQINRQPEIMD